MPAWFSKSPSGRRRGTVAVLTAIMLPVLLGFAALTVDVGLLYNTKADLQRAADAAALAGASAYFSDAGLSGNDSEVAQLITLRAQYVSFRNPTLGQPTILDVPDIALGTHDYDNPTGSLLGSGTPNAVQVIVRRTPGSSNGSVPFFFAGIFSRFEGSVTAGARAAMNDHAAGYRFPDNSPFTPFSIHEDIYDAMVANGPDDFSYDNGVLNVSDGIREVKLFPWTKQTLEEWLGDDGEDAAGNFGTLNMGIGNQGTSYLEDQIANGISGSDIEAEFGTSELVFYDEATGPITYSCGGNPGLSSGIKDTVAGRVGDIVGFFLHRGVSGGGATAVYEIVGIRFGRLVEVQLGSSKAERTITVQPVAYTDGNVIVTPSAPSTDGQLGRVVLVQ